MGKIIFLMGKSSTGKDTIYKRLLEEGTWPLTAIVPYTTRPIREGEREGAEYFFTDEAGYLKWKQSGRIIEEREYYTFHGLWRYFTAADAQIDLRDKDYIMIGTLDSYEKMCQHFGGEQLVPVMIEVDDGERLQRALDRERRQETPGYEELCRRYLADSEDFSPEKMKKAGIDRVFYNNNLNKCLREIEGYIRDNYHK